MSLIDVEHPSRSDAQQVESPIEEDLPNIDAVDIVHVSGNVEDSDASLARVILENQMKRLFTQSRKNKAKRTLFFVLDNRNKKTLTKIIMDNVIAGSTIYTDEWKGYNDLKRRGFDHKTICHKKRFSRFEFQGNVATRITTNNIERMWIELRRTLKYMDMKTFTRYIWLEPYRQMKLFHKMDDANLECVLRDFGTYCRAEHENWQLR